MQKNCGYSGKKGYLEIISMFRGMFNEFRKIINSKAVKNGAWLYVLQLFNSVIPLITLPYITRTLGATEYGYFSVAYNLIGYFMVVVEYGFHMSGARKASLANNAVELHITFTSIVLARLLLCFLCFAGTAVYSVLFIESKKSILCLLLLFFIPLGMVLQQNWLFQGLQQMQYITITSVIARVISLVCIFAFVHDESDLAFYCFFYSATTVVIGLVGTYFAITKLNMRFVKVKWSDVINELKSGWYVFTTAFSSKIFSAFGITVLGAFSTEYNVGIYSAIYKIPQIVLLLWNPISQVMYPINSKQITESYKLGRNFIKKIEKIILPIFGAVLLCISLTSRSIVKLAFGSEFEKYYYIIYPLLFWVLFGIINNFSGVQILLAGGFSKEYSRCFVVGIIVNILLNLLLVWMFGMMGASVAAAVSELLLGILLYIQVKLLDKEFMDRNECEYL